MFSCTPGPLHSILIALFLAGMAPGMASAAPVFVPRDTPQLFVDGSLIAESHALQRTLHSPKKDNGGMVPVLSIPPINGRGTTLEANGSIVYDPRLKRWVMYCLAYVPRMNETREDGWRVVQVLRFTSPDAMHWESEDPNGMDIIFPRTRDDLYDETSEQYGSNIGGCIVHYDDTDPEWPYKGWIWREGLKNDRSGAYYWRSRDGRTFELGNQVVINNEQKIIHNGRVFGGPQDTTRVVYDPLTDRFLASLKFRASEPDPLTGSDLRSRAFIFIDELDEPLNANAISEIELTPPLQQLNGNLPFDEYYDNTAYRYGSHWLGELRIYHNRMDYPWSSAGCTFLKFMSSQDGLHWNRVPFLNDAGHPEVFLANGLEGGNGGKNDGGYMTCFHQAPLQIGDELIYYYGASSYGKNAGPDKRVTGGGIFRARLRLDGFVSVDAGQLTTPPLQFEGETLYVNSAGPVTVEALDENDNSLGSSRLSGDDVRHQVVFDGQSLAEITKTQNTVRLRFTVEPGAALYAFLID